MTDDDYLFPPREWSPLQRIYALTSRRYELAKRGEPGKSVEEMCNDMLFENGMMMADAKVGLGPTAAKETSEWVLKTTEIWVSKNEEAKKDG